MQINLDEFDMIRSYLKVQSKQNKIDKMSILYAKFKPN